MQPSRPPRGGAAVGRWTCHWQVAVQFPACPLSRDTGQLSLASLRGSLNQVPASAGGKGGILTSVGWQVTLCDPYGVWVSRSGVAELHLLYFFLLLWKKQRVLLSYWLKLMADNNWSYMRQLNYVYQSLAKTTRTGLALIVSPTQWNCLCDTVFCM